MSVCSNCGVELEESMRQCPLCGAPVGDSGKTKEKTNELADRPIDEGNGIPPGRSHLLQRILWQVTSILLLSGIVSTLVINLAVQKTISWSIYPVTVCMIIFSYVSLFAFWHTKKTYQVVVGCLIAFLLFLVLHLLLPDEQWPLRVGMPLLGVVNLITIILIITINRTKHRGLNVIAYTSVAIAVLCISIEGILSLYRDDTIILRWSVIVAMCLLPVTAALLFMHIRTRKDPDMKKIFHT